MSGAELNKQSVEHSNEDLNLHRTVQRAKTVMEKCIQHGVHPNPKNFQIFYAYFSEGETSLRNRMDTILPKQGIVSQVRLDQVYRDFFTVKDIANEVALNVGDLVNQSLDDIISAVDGYSSSNDAFRTSLATKLNRLSEAPTNENLKTTLVQLVEENKRIKEDADTLSNSLQSSRDQIGELQSDLKSALEEALLDPLTRLGNRRAMESCIDKILSELQAGELQEDCILVFSDLDHFKVINDQFGHIIGDKVLEFFAQILTENTKGKDHQFRFGGEEFAIILTGISIENAEKAVDAIRSTLNTSKLVLSNSQKTIGKVTASFGVTPFMAGDTRETLLNRADKYLYEAKASGRNCVRSGIEQ
jgi:diguanylate cyclase